MEENFVFGHTLQFGHQKKVQLGYLKLFAIWGCLKLVTLLLIVIHQANIFLSKFGSKTIAITANGVLVGKIHFFAYFWVKNASKSKIWGLPEACHISFISNTSVNHIYAKIRVKNHCQ